MKGSWIFSFIGKYPWRYTNSLSVKIQIVLKTLNDLCLWKNTLYKTRQHFTCIQSRNLRRIHLIPILYTIMSFLDRSTIKITLNLCKLKLLVYDYFSIYVNCFLRFNVTVVITWVTYVHFRRFSLTTLLYLLTGMGVWPYRAPPETHASTLIHQTLSYSSLTLFGWRFVHWKDFL